MSKVSRAYLMLYTCINYILFKKTQNDSQTTYIFVNRQLLILFGEWLITATGPIGLLRIGKHEINHNNFYSFHLRRDRSMIYSHAVEVLIPSSADDHKPIKANRAERGAIFG